MSIASKIVGIFCPPAGMALSVLGKAKSAISGAVTYLFAHPMAAIALLCGYGWAVDHYREAQWHKASDLGQVAITAFKTANAQAIKAATQAKELKDASNAKLAAKGDRDAADLAGRYHASVMRLAAAQSAARRANLPGDADPAQGLAGPGASADVLADPLTISVPDALTCADNTARLVAAHDWAVALGQ